MTTPFTTKEFFAPFFPKNAERRIIAMLRAYFDDSGTHTDGRSQVVVCGGALISDEQHDLLRPAWECILKKSGLVHFHLTKFKSARVSPYLEMTESERDILLLQLLLLGRVRVTYIFASIVPVSVYQNTLTEAEKARYGEAYAWAAQSCWAMIRGWANRHDYPHPIPFVVEAGTAGESQLDGIFDKVVADPVLKRVYRLHSLVKGGKTDFTGLQIADIVANSMFELSSYSHAKGRAPSKPALTIAEMWGPRFVEARRVVFDEQTLRSDTDALNEQYKDTIALIERIVE
jgi:hypothetical protein